MRRRRRRCRVRPRRPARRWRPPKRPARPPRRRRSSHHGGRHRRRHHGGRQRHRRERLGNRPATSIALYEAAKEEGQVNLIALPDTWANYGGILQSFRDKYPGVDNPVANPDASSADELTAVKTLAGQPDMPDALDVGPSFALQAADEGLWAPFQPSTWDEIPDNAPRPRRQLGRRVLRHHGDRDQHDAHRERAADVRRPRRTRSTQGRSPSTAIPARPERPSPR